MRGCDGSEACDQTRVPRSEERATAYVRHQGEIMHVLLADYDRQGI